jgi:streptogramin lyase
MTKTKTKKTRQTRRPVGLETLEDRTLLSTTYVPLDQVLSKGILQANTLLPLSSMDLFSPNFAHNIAPTGQIPPGAVPVKLDGSNEFVYAAANKYIVQLDVTGFSGVAAADPKQMLARAKGELVQAKATSPSDAALNSVSIDSYLGAGRFLVTAGTNFNLESPLLENALGKLPGFKNVTEDFLFPASQLNTVNHIKPPPVPPPAVPPLSEIGAPGGLVFSSSLSQTIGVGATTSYSVQLDVGQTIGAIVTPDSHLRATLMIVGPLGKVLATATGSGAGAMTALQAILAQNPGTYIVTVGGTGGTSGSFTLQVLVNTQLQSQRFLGGTSDGTLASAQQIDVNPLALPNFVTRSAMYGNIPLQAASGDSFVSERGVGVQLITSSGAVGATLNNAALSAGVIQGMHIGPNGNLYVGVDTDPGLGDGGEIVVMTQSGAVVSTIHLPNDTPANFFYYPFGFSVASDGTLWVAQPNSGNVIHVDAAGNLLNSYSVPGDPEWTAIRSDGQIFISNDTGGLIQKLDPGTGTLTTFATDPSGSPTGLSFTPSGDLLVADPNVGVLRYNSAGVNTQVIQDFNAALDAGVDSAGNVLVATFFNSVDKFTSGGAFIHSTSIPGNAIGLAVIGTEGPPPAAGQFTDFYKFSANKGDNLTAVLSDLSGSPADVAIVAPDGSVQAIGKIQSGTEETINSFIAPAKGTFYLRVTGDGVQYSLVLEEGSDFSSGGNTSLATAQNLVTGAKFIESVSGSLSSTALWGVDWQAAPNQLIHTINTLTGAFTSTFSGPTTPLTNPFGFNMAFDGTNLWFNDGANFGSNTIYKLNPNNGAVLGSFAAPTGTLLTGLAYLNGSLWGTDVNFNIYQIDPSTGNLLGQFSLSGFPIVGLAGDPSRGALWAVSQFGVIYQVDPVAKTIVRSGPDHLPFFEQDIGFFNNELYISETNGPGFNDIAVFNATTLTETRDLPMNVGTFISGLAADGFSLTSTNYYHVSANVGDKLFLTATSPYSDPSQGPFVPVNPLQVVLKLYDSNGHLLATSTPGGTINFTVVTKGDYFISVSSATGAAGDYTLSVYGASGPLPAFTVTGTNPPANSYNKPFSSITVDFNDSVLVSSLATANVKFGGLAATGFTVNNDHEVTFFLQAVPPGLNVPYTFQIAAGSIKDIQGVGLTGFSETIFVNTVPPHLTATSVEEGDVDPAGNLVYVVSFNEPINPNSVSAGSFDLHGVFRNADYGPDSFVFNATNTTLTITYSNLPEDNYTETLFDFGFMDRAGYILDGEPHTPRPPSVPSGNGVEGGNFFVDFTLRHGTEALPINFSPVAPLGDLIYRGSFTDVVVPNGASNTYTVNLAANQTLSLDLTTDGSLQASVAVYDSGNNLIASGTSAGKGQELVLQTAPIAAGGTYSVVVSGAGGSEGLFNMQALLNSAVSQSATTLLTAQDLSGSFLSLGAGASRGGVLGSINQLIAHTGDIYASERGGPGVVVVANAGGILSGLNNPAFSGGVVQGMHEGADGNLYVGLDTAPGAGTGGEILKFSSTGTLLATIHLPNDVPPNFFYYPFGFAVAPDLTLWVAQPNSGHVVHVDGSGNLIKSYSVGGNPEWTGVRGDGQVFVSQDSNGTILQLDPGTGNTTTFATDPFGLPFGLTFTTSGNLLVADPFAGVLVYDGAGNLTNTFFDGGAIDAQPDPAGNIFLANGDFNSVDELDSFGNFVNFTNTPGTPIGMAVAGVDGPAPAAPVLDNFYSFHLDAGQSATIAFNQVGGTGTADVSLLDGSSTVLATGTTGPTNFSEVISNFVAGTGGTYYIKVHGNNVSYSLTVTRGAAFDTEPNNSQVTAQPLVAGGRAGLGAVFVPGGVTVGKALEGLSFFDTSCGCIPPDTNHAVGPTQVVETTNTAIRVYDKTTGNILLTNEIGAQFGINAFSDPYIVYDDIAQRFVFVILTLNSSGGDGLALAVSNDSNFMDGFLPTRIVDFGSNLLDFPKVGFNADAYVITGNLFGPSDTPFQVIAVDKQALFGGNFVDYLYQRHPGFPDNFRAEVPAQMHGAAPGSPMYLVTEAGFGNGHAARVVTLTNELSNNPSFTDTVIGVNPYNFPAAADQPGAPGSVATNDTTFSHAEWRMINGHGMLVSAQNVSEPDDGFSTSRVRWYEFSTDGTPSLVQQGTINPGPGVSTYYGAPAINVNGDIGISYMESSANEFVSFYVAGRVATDPLGSMSAGTDVAPGVHDGPFFRAGDYGGIGVDPTDGVTFWASNEYAGTNPVYNTFIASFKPAHPQDEDWYSFSANAGDNLQVTVSVPGSSTGAQFANNLAPVIQLYDSFGNLVASGTTSLSYLVPGGAGGTYAIRVMGASNTQGEYFVQVQGSSGMTPVKLGATPLAATGTPSTSTGSATAGSLSGSTASALSASALPSALPAQSTSSGGTGSTMAASNASSAPTNNPAAAAQASSAAADWYFALLGDHLGSPDATTNWLDAFADLSLQSPLDVQAEPAAV